MKRKIRRSKIIFGSVLLSLIAVFITSCKTPPIRTCYKPAPPDDMQQYDQGNGEETDRNNE